MVRKEKNDLLFASRFWQREKDSNPHKQSQSLSCYPLHNPAISLFCLCGLFHCHKWPKPWGGHQRHRPAHSGRDVVRAGSFWPAGSIPCLIYLSIGPCLAIPRTASTSFEMAVPPFLPSGTPTMWFQFGYSCSFRRRLPGGPPSGEGSPDGLESSCARCSWCWWGRCSWAVWSTLVGTYGACPLPPYDQIPAVQGFLTGYQTMDTIAALNFGIVIVLNIRALGVTERPILRTTIRPA